MDLYYLIYTSVPVRPMNEPELQDLLRVAREANSRFDVTGLLISLPESFIQLIEGPRANIEQLYLNIMADKRHYGVTTLREGLIDKRFFPDWAMAFKSHDTRQCYQKALSLHDDKVLQLFDIIETS
ncbi:BLUF domain-containing protein [Mucilaginibacter ginsenosidivorax]|uniref:BLUF domain-containing protein n=1 Tax=Mucilaginibacter ginsenosidivorax TaxID=862126 RepID=A0A5B8VWS3_9SPHI|nr:BLUF domain-containing protein [Mucilaginibacter ginsenosidivorax]QEC74688.1 BLUF domain-containing protein [Mucilaginibacter ginsenosidivorax]